MVDLVVEEQAAAAVIPGVCAESPTGTHCRQQTAVEWNGWCCNPAAYPTSQAHTTAAVEEGGQPHGRAGERRLPPGRSPPWPGGGRGTGLDLLFRAWPRPGTKHLADLIYPPVSGRDVHFEVVPVYLALIIRVIPYRAASD